MNKYLLDIKDDYESSIYLSSLIVTDSKMGETNYLFVNTTSTHSSLIGLNILNNARLKRYSGDSDASISVSSSVLPYTITQKSSDFSVNSMVASIIIVMGLAYIPSYYIYFVVKEKESNVKHQQLISGLSLPAYWISNLIWDYLCYLIPYYIYIM